jgi:hypothetical protein
MPIFHKIIFKHIFHKRKSIYLLPKGKCIYMLKGKFCVASFWFLAIVILFVLVFFSFTPALKALYLQKFPFFFLRSESNLHFPHPAFGRSGCRLSNSTVIFLPEVSDVWRWPNPVKTLNVPCLALIIEISAISWREHILSLNCVAKYKIKGFYHSVLFIYSLNESIQSALKIVSCDAD